MTDNITLKDSNNRHLRVWCEVCGNFIVAILKNPPKIGYDSYVCMNCGRLVVIAEKGN